MTFNGFFTTKIKYILFETFFRRPIKEPENNWENQQCKNGCRNQTANNNDGQRLLQ